MWYTVVCWTLCRYTLRCALVYVSVLACVSMWWRSVLCVLIRFWLFLRILFYVLCLTFRFLAYLRACLYLVFSWLLKLLCLVYCLYVLRLHSFCFGVGAVALPHDGVSQGQPSHPSWGEERDTPPPLHGSRRMGGGGLGDCSERERESSKRWVWAGLASAR